MDNCDFQQKNTLGQVSAKGLCLGKETESLIRECHVGSSGLSYKNITKNIRKSHSSTSTKNKCQVPFNFVDCDNVSKVNYKDGRVSTNQRKTLSIRDMFSVRETHYNSGLPYEGQKEKKAKTSHKTEISKTAEKKISSWGRERRTLVWSGDSFTTVKPSNITSKTSSGQKKEARKKCTTRIINTDISYIRKKQLNANARKYKTETLSRRVNKTHISGKTHIPGVYSCDKCGRTYRYLRGLRQHKTYSCENGFQFSCIFCEHKTCYKFALRNHIRVCHQEHFEQWFKENYDG